MFGTVVHMGLPSAMATMVMICASATAQIRTKRVMQNFLFPLTTKRSIKITNRLGNCSAGRRRETTLTLWSGKYGVFSSSDHGASTLETSDNFIRSLFCEFLKAPEWNTIWHVQKLLFEDFMRTPRGRSRCLLLVSIESNCYPLLNHLRSEQSRACGLRRLLHVLFESTRRVVYGGFGWFEQTRIYAAAAKQSSLRLLRRVRSAKDTLRRPKGTYRLGLIAEETCCACLRWLLALTEDISNWFCCWLVEATETCRSRRRLVRYVRSLTSRTDSEYIDWLVAGGGGAGSSKSATVCLFEDAFHGSLQTTSQGLILDGSIIAAGRLSDHVRRTDYGAATVEAWTLECVHHKILFIALSFALSDKY